MGFGGTSRGSVKNDINVTPLVDVVLVLLIIFMVITPMLQRGKDVRLPQATGSDDKDKADPIVVSITADRKLWIETTEHDEKTIADQLRTTLQQTPGRKVLLKGDKALTFGDVRRVMDGMKAAGIKGVGLGVEEKKGK